MVLLGLPAEAGNHVGAAGGTRKESDKGSVKPMAGQWRGEPAIMSVLQGGQGGKGKIGRW